MVTVALAPEIEMSLRKRWEPIDRTQLHYLVTWGTRGRRPVLRGRHVEELEAQLHAIGSGRNCCVVEVAAAADHVHVLLRVRATDSAAQVVRELKGSTGMALLERFPELRVWLGGNLMWDERYSIEMVAPLRLDAVRRRLRVLHGHGDELAAAG